MAKEKFGIVGKVKAIIEQKFWGINYLLKLILKKQWRKLKIDGDDGELVDNNVAEQMIIDVHGYC